VLKPPSRDTAEDGCRLVVRLDCSPDGLTGGEVRTRLVTSRTSGDGAEVDVVVGVATLTSCDRRCSTATSCWVTTRTRTRSWNSSSTFRNRYRWQRETVGWTILSWQSRTPRPVCSGFGVSGVTGMVAHLEE